MDSKQISNQQAKAMNHLAGKRIKDALDLLEPLVRDSHVSELIDAHYNLEFSYKSILKYTTEGINDPERQKIYNHLLVNVYQLCDDTFEHLLVTHSGEYAYEMMRKRMASPELSVDELTHLLFQKYEDAQLRSANMGEVLLTKDYTETENRLFQSLWLDNELQASSLRNLFQHPELPWHTKSLLISAMLLHLLRRWNLTLMHQLFELLHHQNHQVQMRALTVLIIILSKHDQRLVLYPEITEQLKTISDDAILTGYIQTLFIQLIRTRETEKISTKLRDEILPEVIRIHPILREKLDLDNLAPETGDDKNPEWEEIFADSPGLLDKLEEITKWQMEGSDVFLSTFQMLKHFPFFNQVSNWFLPFTPQHPAIQEAIGDSGDALRNSGMIEHISMASALCNSDKYSLFLSIPHMPTTQREMMGQFFSAELKQMDEIHQDELLVNPSKRDFTISNQYIQDLYRFFKVYAQKQQFEDIFTWKMDFYKNQFFTHLFHHAEPLEQMGEFLFNKNFHEEALEIFSILSSKNPDNVGFLQKMAYCQMQFKHHDEALQLFLKADLLQPGKTWTLKKIALCYKHLLQPQKALDYYLAAAQISPDNLQTQAAIGHCHLELNNYDEALKYYFKVEYLDQKNTRVWRPIAWCSLVTNKLDQAEKYCLKLLENEKNAHDLINLGHVHLCRGHRKEALECYKQSIECGQTIDAFLKIFAEDQKQLVANGVQPDDLPILLDQLRYSI